MKLLLGEDNNETIDAGISVCRYYIHKKKYHDAVQFLKVALWLRGQREGNETYAIQEMMSLLAISYFELRELSRAIALKEKALAVQKRRRFGGSKGNSRSK